MRYLARESPAGARRLLTRVRKWAATLRALPQRGRVVPELLEFGITTWREMVADPRGLVAQTPLLPEAENILIHRPLLNSSSNPP